MNMPMYYEFCNRVKTVTGHEALEQIPELLDRLGGKKPLFITDRGVRDAGLLDMVISSVSEKIPVGAIEDEVPQDSDLEVVNRISRVYRENGCDAIIAVGGGSVLDTAKGVNILVSEDSDNLMDFTGAGSLKRKLRPLIAIPTTAGTGSEVTVAAVIADKENDRKHLFSSLFLLPDVAVLDSRMTLTLPPHLTALTAMDAMTHAVEAYFCLSHNPMSDACALEAISMIRKNLLHVVKNPDDREGRLTLATAANLAGAAFSNSTVGMVHAIGHSVGSVCHVPHGTAMAILLPYGMEYNMHKEPGRIGELLYPLAGDKVFAETPVEERAEKAVECIRGLNQELFDATGGKHFRNLREVADREGKKMVPVSAFPDIARTALGDGTVFYNPEELDFDDFMMVIEAAWEGIPLDRSRIKKG